MYTVLRPKLEDILDVDRLNHLVAEGMIHVQTHPELPLSIYNYSKVAAYTYRSIKEWPEPVIICRGLIVDADGYVEARPFPKFFNIGQHPRSDLIFSKPFTVTEKLDGSLGIMYPVADHRAYGGKRYQIATRGSFTSDQALEANKILEEKYPDVVYDEDGFDHWAVMEDHTIRPTTALFEIIYPGNRIVCDYAGARDLFFLGGIDNATGLDLVLRPQSRCPFPLVREFSGVDCRAHDVLDMFRDTAATQSEGFVLCFEGPKGRKTRVKVKYEEYIRLHRIVTGVSTKTVWEYLKDKKDFAELLERVPDEFYNWIRKTQTELIFAHDELLQDIRDEFESVSKIADPSDRKHFAEVAKNARYTHPLFMLLDGKVDQLDQWVWDEVRPEFSKAFSMDIDA